MFAAQNPNPEVVKYFLNAGLYVNSKDKEGTAALAYACIYNDNPEVIEALLAAGAEINAPRVDGATALMVAAFFNNPEIVKLLLDDGADATIVDAYGGRALDYTNEQIRKSSVYYELLMRTTR